MKTKRQLTPRRELIEIRKKLKAMEEISLFPGISSGNALQLIHHYAGDTFDRVEALQRRFPLEQRLNELADRLWSLCDQSFIEDHSCQYSPPIGPLYQDAITGKIWPHMPEEERRNLRQKEKQSLIEAVKESRRLLSLADKLMLSEPFALEAEKGARL